MKTDDESNDDEIIATTRDTVATVSVDDKSIVPAVRLIQLSLAGRAEGTITAIKDSYGFIQYAERPIDVHFKLSHILPDHIQNDIRYYMSHVTSSGTAITSNNIPFEVGTQVQFDISLHGTNNKNTTTTTTSTSGSHHRQKMNIENMKGQRIVFVPPNTFTTSIRISDNVRGIITKQDAGQPYCGAVQIELDDTNILQSNSNTGVLRQRHPLIVKMLETYIKQTSQSLIPPPIEYHDIQSIKEVNKILELAEIIGKGQLTHQYTTHSRKNESNFPGRLVVLKKDDQDLTENNVDAADNVKSEQPKEEEAKKSMIIRCDRKSYGNEASNDIPASIDDAVECSIVLCRRTGSWRIENLRITERSSINDSDMTVSSSNVNGTIKELLNDFGFITVLDEKFNSKKNEVIMFMFNDTALNGNDKVQFREGDPVRFDISTATNGKRLAVNVSNRLKQTKKSSNPSVDKNICLGVILLEPSLSTLKNTPIRKASSNVSTEKTSRWETGDDHRSKTSSDDILTDLGCIVLTSDPGKVFGGTIQQEEPDEADSHPSYKESASPTIDETVSNSSSKEVCSTPGLHQHLRYKVSSLFTYQPGAMVTDVAKSLTPRRGDLVSFVKIKNTTISKSTNQTDVVVRELRLMTKGAASLIRGKLEWLSGNDGGNKAVDRMARFVCDDDPQATYDVRPSEIISCDPSLLKDQECVEGILYEGRLYGIARLTDLYLESKYSGANNKERPKLNLTVKKDLGGKIVAQSMMAKGPDGTNGFALGWTQRMSRFSSALETGCELKVYAPEFTPMGQPN